jgi:hypothetical protein
LVGIYSNPHIPKSNENLNAVTVKQDNQQQQKQVTSFWESVLVNFVPCWLACFVNLLLEGAGEGLEGF